MGLMKMSLFTNDTGIGTAGRAGVYGIPLLRGIIHTQATQWHSNLRYLRWKDGWMGGGQVDGGKVGRRDKEGRKKWIDDV